MRTRILVGLLSGAAFLALALWGVPLEELGRALAQVRWAHLLPVAALFMLQQVLRAWRQLVILRAVAPRATWLNSFAILCMSFFLINTLPARLGELARPWFFQRREGVPLGAGFGVVFVERAVDLVAAIAMMLGVLIWVEVPPRRIEVGGTSWEVVELGRVAATSVLLPVLVLLLALILGGAPVLARLRRVVAAVVARTGWTRAGRLAEAALAFAEHFVEGLSAVRQPGRLAAILGITALTWGSTGWIYVSMAHATGLEAHVGYGEGIGILAITMLGTILPAPPGMAGVYEAFVRGALVLFGVHGGDLDGRAVAYALVVHWWTYLVQSASALWFFVTGPERLADVVEVVRRRRSA